MKPGDHPEFFRFPAPAGRSRESTLRIDREGQFWHDGEQIAHPGMQLAFARWVRRHPDDGRYILSNGYDWTYVVVDDVPFTVRSVGWDAGWPMLRLSDGTEERLEPSALRLGAADALYTGVKGGEFEARFSRFAQLSLERALEELPDGGVGLRIGQEVYPMPQNPKDAPSA